MLRIFIITLFMHIAGVSFADCNTSYKVLGAMYKVSDQVANKSSDTHHMTLWRNNHQVAHEYTDTHITEIWELVSNGMLRMERHFDAYERGIEYQPNEINKGKGERDWSLKYQLISNRLKDKMDLTHTNETGCDKVEFYQLEEDKVTIQLEWLPEQKLIKHYQVTSPEGVLVWALEKTVLDTRQTQGVFTSRANYNIADYADIGDNESDPFFSKLINMGFVEHGPSGFYDSEGHAMNGHHQH